MNLELKIQFGKSWSVCYDEAINLASKFKNFRPACKDRPNTVVTTQDTIRNDFELIEQLWSIVRPWKSSKLFINGKCKTGYDAYNAIQKTIIPLTCHREYQKAIIQDLHCRYESSL